MGTRPWKRLAFASLAILLGTGLGLGMAEALIRLFVPEQNWRIESSWSLWQADPDLGWTMRPNARLPWNLSFAESWTIETNRDGLRPSQATPERRAGVFRVLLFGDSTVASIGVKPEQALHSQLERVLKEKGLSAEVLNAAVEGYSTDQSLLRMTQLVPRYRPDFVLYGFCRNDLGGNVSGEDYGMPKPRYVRRADGTLELVRPSGNGTIPDYRSPLNRILQRSSLFAFVRPLLMRLRGGKGHLDLNDEAFSIHSEEMNKFDWDLLAAEMGEMKAVAAKYGARFAFFSHPELGEVWEPHIRSVIEKARGAEGSYDRFVVEKRLLKISERDRLPFVPLVSRFLANQNRGPFHLLPRDPHSNGNGYSLIAESLGESLVEQAVSSQSRDLTHSKSN